MEKKLNQVLNTIEKIQKEDPNHVEIDGQKFPKEYLYGTRMTEMLHSYEPRPSEALLIAAKGQHIKRWEIPRDNYPKDRKGYLKWRTEEKLMHGKLLSQIMLESGFDREMAMKVNDLVTKKRLKSDPETQILEDVVCLVFLKYYFGEFAEEHPHDKVIHILQKTWTKMTEKGHQMAHQLPIGEKEQALVLEALT